MATRTWIGLDTAGDWSVAANWTGAAVPVDGDDVYLENSSQDVNAGLGQTLVALASLNIAQSYTGSIGTSTAYLKIGSVLTNIGYHYGRVRPQGSPLMKLDLNDSVPTAGTINVWGTGTSSDPNVPSLRLLVNAAASILNVYKGDVGLAAITGEASVIGTINVSSVTNVAADADMFISDGVTLTSLKMTGGDTILNCAATLATLTDGTLQTNGSGAITTANVTGGRAELNSSGTITALNIPGGSVDMTKSTTVRTITTLKRDPGAGFKYDVEVIILTNKIQPVATSGVVEYR